MSEDEARAVARSSGTTRQQVERELARDAGVDADWFEEDLRCEDVEDEDNDGGRTAQFAGPLWQTPFTEDPQTFIRRMQPVGLPQVLMQRILEGQRADAFCVRTSRQYREARL